MSLEIVALALLAAACWGAGSPLSKLGMEHDGTPAQVALTVVTVSAALYWTILLATGTGIDAHAPWVLALFVATGLVSTALARLLTFAGIERLGSSVNSAGINTRPVWASVLAVVVLGETVTVQMGIGIVVTVAGLVALAFSDGGDLSGWNRYDLAIPLGAALTYGVGNVARRYAFTASSVTPLEGVALNETAGIAGILGYLLVRTRSLDDLYEALVAPPRAYAFFAGSAVLNALALFVLFEALSRGPVVVVDPLSAPTSLFSIALTAVLLRDVERVTRRVLVGAAFVIGGVVLITGPQLVTLPAIP
jgi:drug/metabolite transporter (DMT)-like permease